VAVHLSFAGAAARPPRAHAAGAPEPISIRYLLPPKQPLGAPVERINWAAIGAGINVPAAAPPDVELPARDADESALASRLPAVPVEPVALFEPGATFQEYEVDSAATHDPASGGPEYPDSLRVAGVQGEVLVEFAVDTTGHADSTTFVVVTSTHPEFTRAVRDALPRMLFSPAIAGGRRVRQLVRLPMRFKLLTETAQGTT
jgi:protein TonB